MDENLSRRGFLKAGAGAAAGLLAGQNTLSGRPAARQSIRLGGPIFNPPEDPEELALAHRKLGYRGAYCPNISLNDGDRIRAVSRAFQKHDVVIAEVGRWVNLMDRDSRKREKNLNTVTEGLALAEAVGALCCVDIAGSYSRSSWFGPDPENVSREFFDEAVENARKIIDAVKPGRAKFCYEMMGWAIPDSPESYEKLLQAVDRKAFGVHLDPCNLINSPRRFWRNGDLINECFDRLGPHIVSCHAKDLAWKLEMNIHFQEVRPGAGALDYRTFLERLTRLPHQAPLMLEHLPSAVEYDRARLHILDLGKKNGIEF